MRDDAIPLSETFGKHVEVVAVEMHGVGSYECVIDNKTHRRVGAEVIGVPDIWVREIARVCKGEDRVASNDGQLLGDCYRRRGGVIMSLLIIGTEGLVIHIEQEDVATVRMGRDGEVLGHGGIPSRWKRKVWSRQAEVVLPSVSTKSIGRGEHHTLPHLRSS